MVSPRIFSFLVIVVASSVWASTVLAQDFSFKPWSDVTAVCPTCQPPTADTIDLRNGDTVEGRIKAVNDRFYTLERFGEIRTVPTRDISSVSWEGGSQPSGIDRLDQILLTSGHVLTGRITIENGLPPFYEIESDFFDQSYTVFKSQIAMVFRNGEEYDFESALNQAAESERGN